MALTQQEREERKAFARSKGWQIFAVWFVLTAIVDYLTWFVWGPHMPPGTMTTSAAAQQFDFKILMVLVVPVLFMVWVYGGFALVNFRARKGEEDQDGIVLFGNRKIQGIWYVASTVLVLGLAVFGTYELIANHDMGSGSGPSPIWNYSWAKATPQGAWTPGGSTPLVVQVIAQQWRFTYRYPQFGGMETTELYLPTNARVVFDVTSLDVIHDFWAYQLGVKADANPGVNNVATTETTSQTGKITVRCDELCGIWHGAMYNYGEVLPASSFETWATNMQAANAGVTKLLPPFALTYTPSYSGAGGGYYPSYDPNGHSVAY
ncbi:cytochrome c oxidase subunit II [Acidimicrobium ferrooxidans]|nr:cytochrome c oxidase subunit II [Acidimicrobium ferrooxidans]